MLVMPRIMRDSLTLVVVLAVPFAACGCGGTGPGASSPPSERLASTETAFAQPERGRDGRFGGPAQPGQILPSFLQERLNLTEEQKTTLEALQKEADGKLEKILTDDQKKQLKEMREGVGPGGPGGPPPDFGPPPGERPEQP
jgi:hypothetical protein